MPILRVRAWLDTPVALGEPLHLDGLLAACAIGHRGARLTRTCDAGEIVRPRIPLLACRYADHELYLCSAAEPAPTARRTSEHLTRRRSPEDLDALTHRIDTRSGPGRDVLLRFPLLLTPYLDWWAIANRKPLLHLLRRTVLSVGMLRRHGYGHVKGWEIERQEDGSADRVLVQSGRALRNLPAEWCEAPEIIERVPVVHPYWHPSSAVDGVRAGRLTGIAGELRDRLPRSC